MRKTFIVIIAIITIFLSSILPVMAGQEIVPADVTVKVQYQLKMDGYNSWTTTNASLRGAVSESMMISQLAARHPSGQIRILSASYGKTVSHIVRYQMKRGKSAWTNGTVTLNNALTESMARNQLKAKFPGATIRILSFVKKK
ncbi:MAG: hypothetical protein ACI4UV_01945 [Victivallales bacterium]